MKKYLILSMILFLGLAGYAQKGKVSSAASKVSNYTISIPGLKIDEKDVAAAKVDIDAALQDSYTKTWAKTYVIASQVYAVNYKLTKDPQDLFKANEFLTKAVEYNKSGDEKGKQINKYTKEIKEQTIQLKNDMINGGIEAWNQNQFGAAAKLFGSSSELGHSEMFTKDNMPIDTAIIYNAAIAASKAEDHTTAIKYYTEVTKYGYEGVTPYLYMSGEYLALNDTLGLIEMTKEGLAKYPNDDQGLLMQLINLYLAQNKFDDAATYLDQAIVKEPNKSILYFAKGVTDEHKNDFAAAEASYRKAIELDSQNADAQYNLGVIQFNKGVEVFNNARDIKDNKAYDAEMAKSKDKFKEALPYFEKANELKPKTPSYLSSLKQLYYRLGDNDNMEKIQTEIDNL